MYSIKKSLEKPVQATVTGTIPNWLSGTLYRNGGGLYELNGKKMSHLFDGLACIHKFEIKDGNVVYSNRLIETTAYKKSIEEDRLGICAFGTPDLCSTLFGRLKMVYYGSHDGMDNNNVNIVPFANRQLYALTEANYIVRVDPKNLNVLGKFNVTDKIPTSKSTIAHPHVLPDGSWIEMGSNGSGYDFVKYDGNGLKDANLENILDNGKLINSIKSNTQNGYSYFHSFGLTQNYIVFLEQSLKVSYLNLLSGVLLNRAFSQAMYMEPKCNTRIHLINRNTGQLVEQQFHTDPLFLFHHINAYEKRTKDNKTEILVDFCGNNPETFDINELKYEDVFTDKLVHSETSHTLARRITIPLDSTTSAESIYCKVKDLNSNHSLELPNMNYSKCNTLPYKYAYGCNFYKKPYSIVKINVDNPEESWEHEFELPSEPVFVENPNGQSEDDGVLLVMCQTKQSYYLSILDAKDLSEIAKADLSAIPIESTGGFTFHGFFADNINYKDLV